MKTDIHFKTDIKQTYNTVTGEFERQAVRVTASVIGRDGVVRSAEAVGRGVNPSLNELGRLIKKSVSLLPADVLVDSLYH